MDMRDLDEAVAVRADFIGPTCWAWRTGGRSSLVLCMLGKEQQHCQQGVSSRRKRWCR